MKKIFIITLILLANNMITYGQERSRSSKTGKYVTKEFANKHKSTTYTSKTKSKK